MLTPYCSTAWLSAKSLAVFRIGSSNQKPKIQKWPYVLVSNAWLNDPDLQICIINANLNCLNITGSFQDVTAILALPGKPSPMQVIIYVRSCITCIPCVLWRVLELWCSLWILVQSETRLIQSGWRATHFLKCSSNILQQRLTSSQSVSGGRCKYCRKCNKPNAISVSIRNQLSLWTQGIWTMRIHILDASALSMVRP